MVLLLCGVLGQKVWGQYNMGLLKFTKKYSASDDGNSLTGSELEQIQADISSVVNGGLSNINVASDAGIIESKLAFDATSGHNHDGSNSRELSAGGQRGYIQGAELEWVSTTTVKAQSGVLEIAGSFYTRNSYSTTLDLTTNAHWVEGTSQQGTSKWVYIYAYNNSGSTWDIKFWLQSPQYANTDTDDSSIKIYRETASVWYRCLGAIRLNATGAGEIQKFYQTGNYYHWQYSSPTVSTSDGDIACSAFIPPVIATLAFFGLSVTNAVAGVVQYTLNQRGGGAGFAQVAAYCSTNGERHQGTTFCQTDGTADQYVTATISNGSGTQSLELLMFVLLIR